MTRSKICHFIDDTRGASLVEAALIVPVFLLISFGSILWALTMWEQITLQHAVEMEARCAVLPGVVTNAATPYCGYFQCSSAQACAVLQTFGFGAVNSNFNAPTLSTSGPGTFCAQTNNFPNKFTIGLIPQIPARLNAFYCRYSQ